MYTTNAECVSFEEIWASLTLHIAEKRRDVKSKGGEESYTHMNAEFYRLARRDEKAFLTEQCKKQRKTVEWQRLKISSRKLER